MKRAEEGVDKGTEQLAWDQEVGCRCLWRNRMTMSLVGVLGVLCASLERVRLEAKGQVERALKG